MTSRAHAQNVEPPTTPAGREFSPRRSRSLQTTVGRAPTIQDFGSETDMLGITDDTEITARVDRWNVGLKGYMRATLPVGIGPRNDGQEGKELHTAPRIIGAGSGRYEYASLLQNPSFSLYAYFGNPIVAANVTLSSGTMLDASFYGNADRATPGVQQAYLTLKFPEVFGSVGGMALTVGAFSNRYGSAGREQVSAGYYGVYLFGRTHIAGETLVADIDISDSWELVLEHGIGAKSKVIQFLTPDSLQVDVRDLDYLEGVGQVPQGSTFVHHAHAAMLHEGWMMLAAHWMTSWTPDDNSLAAGVRVPEGRLTVVGAEMHIDDDALGNGYIGFSHVNAKNLAPLSNGLAILHGSTGRGFKESFFGERDRVRGFTPTNSSGTVDTLLFQYTLNLGQYLGTLPFAARDLTLSLYSMLNHAVSPSTIPDDPLQVDIDQYKLKFGTELQLALRPYFTPSFRYDRVLPNVSDTATGYTSLTPRIFIRSSWNTKEYITLSYTHFFLGERAYPSSPFSDLLEADPDLFSIAATMSF
jgi:hypothetical protein